MYSYFYVMYTQSNCNRNHCAAIRKTRDGSSRKRSVITIRKLKRRILIYSLETTVYGLSLDCSHYKPYDHKFVHLQPFYSTPCLVIYICNFQSLLMGFIHSVAHFTPPPTLPLTYVQYRKCLLHHSRIYICNKHNFLIVTQLANCTFLQ